MSELLCISDYEEKAKSVLTKSNFIYFSSGSGDELTINLNRDAFKSLRIRPRFLRNVSQRNTNQTLFDINLPTPIGISPTAMHKIAHPDGELATAKAAGKFNTIFILSSLSTTSMEQIAQESPETIKWFQLYIYKDRFVTENLIRRAERADFKALVLTIDSPRKSLRHAHAKCNFQLSENLRFENFYGVISEGYNRDLIHNYILEFDKTITWKDIEWLINFTTLPVILKGILTKEDALLALQYGCSGIIVSNHGGRQLDSVPATIEVLPEIVNAVGNKVPVMIDGGITQGTDVFKALALGAKMVFIGKPIIWGLAVDGERGVEDILKILQNELELTMDLAGCAKLSNIKGNMIVHKSYYSKLINKL